MTDNTGVVTFGECELCKGTGLEWYIYLSVARSREFRKRLCKCLRREERGGE